MSKLVSVLHVRYNRIDKLVLVWPSLTEGLVFGVRL